MGPGPPTGEPASGFLLSLLTESFAVRALLGSLVAAGLTAAALHWRWVRGSAGRVVILAPILAAAAAGVASVVEAEAYLPQLWVTSSGVPSGQVLELLGELRVVSDRGVDLLVVAWLSVVLVLAARRIAGARATRALVRTAQPLSAGHQLRTIGDGLERSMRTGPVEIRLLPRCPGGALTTGVRRPVVLVDPELLTTLDTKEIEGLLAHELAHIARRDTLLATVVGVFSDLTFFLPPVHWTRRWLQREREEGADGLASAHTGRPAALASSILKVYHSAPAGRRTDAVCTAVPVVVRRRSWRLRPQVLSHADQTVTMRIERLVSPVPARTVLRQICEIAVAVVVVLAASTVTLVVPRWIATELGTYSLAFGYVPPPIEPVESSAFATFRALAPTASPAQAPPNLRGYERWMGIERPAQGSLGASCPCVESQAQWLAGVPATAPAGDQTMTWQRTAGPAWDVDLTPGSVQARPLLTLPETRPQVGFFVVARPDQ